jgi:tetratricopeptide (TPR) repeat protein/V8-like Glu-specific endopeptidase
MLVRYFWAVSSSVLVIFSLSKCSWENLPTRVEKSTVLITHKDKKGKQEQGTGFFIQHPKKFCTVLTAGHVTANGKTLNLKETSDTKKLETQIELNIKTHDGKTWKAANIQTISNMDIAVVTFDAGLNCPYPHLELDQSDKVKIEDTISIAGFPVREVSKGNNSQILFQFVPGKVTAIPPYPLQQGYGISYDATTPGGMSGGPVVNNAGKVVAIHGVTDREVAQLAEINDTQFQSASQEEVANKSKDRVSLGIPTLKWGISIKYYLQNIPEISLTPAQPDAKDWNDYGYQMLLSGDYQNALTFFSQATKINSKLVDAWYYKGVASVKLEKYQDALISFNKTLNLEPKSHQALTQKGLILIYQKQLDESLYLFDKAINLKKDHAESFFGKGLALFFKKNLKESIKYLDRAVELQKNDERFWYFRGLALEQLGKAQDAIKSFDKAISINRNNYFYWIAKSSVYLKLEQYNDSLEFAQKAINIKPDSIDAWMLKSFSFFYLGQYDKAYKSVENVLRLEPNNEQGEKLKGEILRQLGE